MKIAQKKKVSQEEVLAAIRSAAEKADGKPLHLRAFLAKSRLHRRDVYRYYGSWGEALAAAGINPPPRTKYLEPEELLMDWGAAARKLQRAPTHADYEVHGKYCPRTYQLRFGSWLNVRRAFRTFAEGKSEWADVVKFCAPPRRPGTVGRRGWVSPRPRREPPARRRDDRPIYGEPLDVPGLCNAPTHESGVIYVFGMVAERLGFHVQMIRPTFPDCEALRRAGTAIWQTVKIEFEFESRNFRDHGHPPDGCDIIVCWIHNWQECPANLEVIALSDYVAQSEMTNDE